MLYRRISMDLTNATSLPESAGGPSHWDSQGLILRRPSGQVVVLANLSAKQAKAQDVRMIGISGPLSHISHRSAGLQSSLESRLRARLDVNGSPEYKLTWKSWDIAPGRRICALRASVPRTCVKDCTGWPSPVANDAKSSDYTYANGDKNKVCLKLGGAAKMAGWPTPVVADAKRGTFASEAQAKGKDGKRGAQLPTTAKIAGWATPRATDADKNVRSPAGALKEAERKGGNNDLGTTAAIAGWATPAASEPGGSAEQFLERKRRARANGSTLGISLTALSLQVQTGNSGVLNPDLSRWLMGFPAEWGYSGATETQ